MGSRLHHQDHYAQSMSEEAAQHLSAALLCSGWNGNAESPQGKALQGMEYCNMEYGICWP